MNVKLLAEHHLVFLSLKGGCRGSSESTLVKMSNCWKSHATAHLLLDLCVTFRIKRLSLYVKCFMSYILFVDILLFQLFLLDFFLSQKWLDP